MKIIHVLADGSEKTDITGHVIRADDAKSFYETLRNIEKKYYRGNSEVKTND